MDSRTRLDSGLSLGQGKDGTLAAGGRAWERGERPGQGPMRAVLRRRSESWRNGL